MAADRPLLRYLNTPILLRRKIFIPAPIQGNVAIQMKYPVLCMRGNLLILQVSVITALRRSGSSIPFAESPRPPATKP